MYSVIFNRKNCLSRIAQERRNGYAEDPTNSLIQYLDDAGINNIEAFYRQYINNKPIVYCVVGDSKKIDMKQLESLCQIIKVKKKDVYTGFRIK